jgi:hypothetical protein
MPECTRTASMYSCIKRTRSEQSSCRLSTGVVIVYRVVLVASQQGGFHGEPVLHRVVPA